MTVPYQASGRTKQKARTLAAIVKAARELQAKGADVTVSDVAEHAGVSRTTAYRYFPTRESLLVEAHLQSAMPEIDQVLEATTTAPAEEQIDRLTDAVSRFHVEHESETREMLRLSLDGGSPDFQELRFRQGRRVRWIETALDQSDLDLSSEDRRRLVAALTSMIGIEALIVLTDICGFNREKAREVMRWAARALVEAARRDSV